MKIAQIEENLHKVVKPLKKESFIYDLLLSYGLPKASITRLRKEISTYPKTTEKYHGKRKSCFGKSLKMTFIWQFPICRMRQNTINASL